MTPKKPSGPSSYILNVWSLKANKNSGYDNIHVNGIRNLCSDLKTPLMNIFNLSLNTGIFPDRMKIAKVTPIFKIGEKCYIFYLF